MIAESLKWATLIAVFKRKPILDHSPNLMNIFTSCAVVASVAYMVIEGVRHRPRGGRERHTLTCGCADYRSRGIRHCCPRRHHSHWCMNDAPSPLSACQGPPSHIGPPPSGTCNDNLHWHMQLWSSSGNKTLELGLSRLLHQFFRIHYLSRFYAAQSLLYVGTRYI